MKKYLATLKKISKEFKGDKKAEQACQYLFSKIEAVMESQQELHFDSSLSSPPSALLAGSQQLPIPHEIKNGGIAAFSDGACRGNPGPGSWAFIVQQSSGEVIVEDSEYDDHTTNNKMELMGAIKALEYFASQELFSQKLFLYTDSTYVVKGITDWVSGWKARGWKKADRKAPVNVELWQQLDQLYQQFDFLDFRWVKGHSGHPQNERCDQLANIALDNAGY